MKIIIFLFAALLIVGLVGCSSTGVSTSTPATTYAQPAASTTTTPAKPSNSTSAPAPQTTQATPPINTTGGSAMQWNTQPAMTIDQNKTYTALMDTNYGKITIQLFPKDAPLAVNSFVFLARQNFFNNVKFHRIVKGFVIQGGDPTGTGSGGPGYKFADEKVTRNYLPGTLAMANSGPNTNGSQFFICLADLTNSLPKNYTIFGIVTEGMDVVQKIGNLPVTFNPSMGETSKPTVEVKINSVTITEQ
jgi:cyclophilin family peptidyl-prolyl cis-trans isomerase